MLANFAVRLLSDQPPIVYEDGRQQRDFVSVHDIVQACRLAIESPDAAGRVFNIGSGRPQTVLEVASKVARAIGKEDIEPQILGKYRVGDIRHCFADIRLARRVLQYEPRVSLEHGLDELAGWLEGQKADDRVRVARAELDKRGLCI